MANRVGRSAIRHYIPKYIKMSLKIFISLFIKLLTSFFKRISMTERLYSEQALDNFYSLYYAMGTGCAIGIAAPLFAHISSFNNLYLLLFFFYFFWADMIIGWHELGALLSAVGVTITYSSIIEIFTSGTSITIKIISSLAVICVLVLFAILSVVWIAEKRSESISMRGIESKEHITDTPFRFSDEWIEPILMSFYKKAENEKTKTVYLQTFTALSALLAVALSVLSFIRKKSATDLYISLRLPCRISGNEKES